MTPKGAKECAPKELAIAKAELDGVRHQATESWDDVMKTGPWSDSSIPKADKAADTLLAKTKACQPPVVKFSANPEAVSPGQCSTLTWSSQNVQKAEIDQEVGAVAASGSKQVCPKETTPYTLTATGTGGTVYETATVTVMAPMVPPPPPPAAAPVPAPVVAPVGGRGNPSRQLRHGQIQHPAGGPRGAAEGGRLREEVPERQVPRGGIYGQPRQRQIQPEAVRAESGGREEISRGRGRRHPSRSPRREKGKPIPSGTTRRRKASSRTVEWSVVEVITDR